jgi:hypothetical protein
LEKVLKGSDLVAQMKRDTGGEGFLEACLHLQGLCVMALVKAKSGQKKADQGKKNVKKQTDLAAVKSLQALAEKLEGKKSNKKIKVSRRVCMCATLTSTRAS